jgi:hypothetical protein
MTTQTFCPYRQATLLQQALAPDKMRIAFLLGAGCPVSIEQKHADGTSGPLIPDIQRLTAHVDNEIGKNADLSPHYAKLMARLAAGEKAPNIEEVLSYTRNLGDVVRHGEIDGMTKATLDDIDREICRIITRCVNASLPADNTPYHQLATWVKGIARINPVEVFTPNYDVLIEQAFESRKTPYFDGFVGAKQAFFDLAAMETDPLPPRWARLWKLHGSINWWRTTEDEVVRRETGNDDDRQMIYPSHLKYDQSRRMPYLAMLDRLREFLAKGQAVLITCGYSFSDQHLNEVITTGLRANPTAICFALMFGPRAQYVEALAHAKAQPNLSVLAEDGAVLGASERDWHAEPQASHSLHGTCVLEPSVSGLPCRLTLGDFVKLGQFLGQQLSRGEEVDAAAI